MFFDIVYHNFVQNAAKVVLINITEIEFSHRYEFGLFSLEDIEAVLRGL